MDTLTGPEVADQLGVALSTVHALLDEANVPRRGRGHARAVPMSVVEGARKRRGAVPERPDGLTRSQMLLLAALSRAPLGASSARAAAALAGVSPTAAARDLPRLEHRRLVDRVERNVAEDRVRRQRYWQAAAMTPEVLRAVRKVQLPALEEADTSARLPRRLYSHFWNADPQRLSVEDDGSYIASRLLRSDDVTAVAWALRHVPDGDIDTALHRRGLKPEISRMVENWRAT
ncbi:hypothetical protein [Agrococcus sp. KRD186]|uniref:hypothetical protein n=1 Tax=Agrococcus sp. KRD186 TaxID=2729730 RepID=UPI0019D0B55E|nr:hypothetical protein [Agrococcus sp. KRD186]